ncbi:MAG: 30S ribosomal protein S20 [Armatimonadetes bacterium]|nr:30S ribosomal protein S20 [Armatimonadota bacterium]
MANLKSSQKDIIKSRKRRLRNQAVRSAIKTFVKKTRLAIERGDENRIDLLSQASSLVDKAAKRGIIHRNAANRRKSRLAQRLNRAGEAAAGQA